MSCCLKDYAKKTVVLTPQRPQGAITPLTPLTSELAKFEFKIEYWLYFKSDSVGQTKRHKIKLIVGFKDTFAVDVIAVLNVLFQGIVLVDVFSDISILAQ